MAKCKPSEVTAAAENVERNIRARGAMLGVNDFIGFERRTGISRTTFSRRAREPRGWTLEQLAIIAAAFRCPLEWFFQNHVEGGDSK